jgi:mannose/fructose/N-acetylgalactosamine-specific phosphotransferase system component IIB
MPINLVRVDHRLVHGQVTMGWSRAVNADLLLVVNDRVAGSPFDVSLMGMAVPPGVRLEVMSLAQAEEAAASNGWPDARILMLVANPLDLKRLVDAGLDLDEVNIGGVRSDGARHKLTKEVHATDAEMDAWRALAQAGVRLSVQWLPSQKRKLLNDSVTKG